MTQEETMQHWRKGAESALRMAQLGCQEGEYALSLFHRHLAVEKTLKAKWISDKAGSPPPSHNLPYLAHELSLDLTSEQKKSLEELTQYVIDARYDDPSWAESQATKENCEHWIQTTEKFLSLLMP